MVSLSRGPYYLQKPSRLCSKWAHVGSHRIHHYKMAPSPKGRLASFEINNLSVYAHMPVLLTHSPVPSMLIRVHRMHQSGSNTFLLSIYKEGWFLGSGSFANAIKPAINACSRILLWFVFLAGKIGEIATHLMSYLGGKVSYCKIAMF